MPIKEPILDVINVWASYTDGFLKTPQEVLRDVSFSIAPGEIFGLVGGSGSGKTTLTRAILGLLDFKGTIKIAGRERRPGRHREFARTISAVFQDPAASLDPKKTVGYLLDEPLRIHKIADDKRADEILEAVGLDSSYRSRRTGELSGGQLQRVAIGVALMLSPSLLIADEPVSSLDVSVAAQIINLLSDLRETLGLSMLFISHNLQLVHYLCDRIAVMQNGSLVNYVSPGNQGL